MYIEKSYRYNYGGRHRLEVIYKSADIFCVSDVALNKDHVASLVKRYYCKIEEYVKIDPVFQSSLRPVSVRENAPPIIQAMAEASKLSAIGPFSAVAGAVAQFVGMDLLGECTEIILENGGDLFLKIKEPKKVGLYAGEGSLLNNFSITLEPCKKPFGLAASSGKLGHSLSLGNADLVVISADDSIIADTFATVVCNQVKKKSDALAVINTYKDNPGIQGLGIYIEEELYVWNLALSII